MCLIKFTNTKTHMSLGLCWCGSSRTRSCPDAVCVLAGDAGSWGHSSLVLGPAPDDKHSTGVRLGIGVFSSKHSDAKTCANGAVMALVRVDRSREGVLQPWTPIVVHATTLDRAAAFAAACQNLTKPHAHLSREVLGLRFNPLPHSIHPPQPLCAFLPSPLSTHYPCVPLCLQT